MIDLLKMLKYFFWNNEQYMAKAMVNIRTTTFPGAIEKRKEADIACHAFQPMPEGVMSEENCKTGM